MPHAAAILRFSLAVLAFLAPLAGTLRAQTDISCVENGPFKLEPLVQGPIARLDEPMKMAFDMDAEGHVDIYFVERQGKVRRYDARTGQVQDLGSPALIYSIYDAGLSGIALDPAFKQNRRLYLGHAALTKAAGFGMEFRVTRFTLGADGRLDPASAKTLIAVPAANKAHCAVVPRFDAEGNLFVAISDNYVGEVGSANTNDLRGKILRIRPTEEGGYTVPPGNLFPAGLPGTRPEIYVMGVRQPYALAYDPGTGRLAWGEFGPDGIGARTEEHNITDRPGNFGWPHFAGRQIQLFKDFPRDPSAPANASPENTGLKILPPAVPAVHVYGQSGSVTGPIYRTPPGNPLRRLSARYDGMWFITDFNQGWVDTIRLNADGTGIAAQGRLKDVTLTRPIDFQMGPDGGLYVINYVGYYSYHAEANISRLVGPPCAPIVGLGDGPPRQGQGRWSIDGGNVHVTGGPHRLALRDLSGHVLAEYPGDGAAAYDLARMAGGRSGVYLVEFESSGARQVRRVALTGP